MSRSQTPEDRWNSITFTLHAESRMKETGCTKEWVIRALQRSVPALLPPEIEAFKKQKYPTERQERISYWQFGSILFTVSEEADGQIVIVTITNQHVETYKMIRRRNAKARPQKSDEEFRSVPYREQKKWR